MSVPRLTRWQERRRKRKEVYGYVVAVLFALLLVSVVILYAAYLDTVTPMLAPSAD